MKKLMTIAVAIMASAIVNAASVNWDNGGGDLYESGGTGNLATGYLAFFVSAADLTRADAITAVGAGNLTAITAVGYESSVGLSDAGWLEDSGVGNFTPGEDLTAYLIVFNADAVGNATYAYVSATETEHLPGSGMGANFEFDLSGSATAGNWTAVPEPTSGLLLVVGGALLALRRRRLA